MNNSPDVNATNSMMSQATVPLAESGYYVFPVTLVNETFRHNGLTTPSDIHELPVIGARSSAIIEENMVFTIEPGIYLPGEFGVRIEDTIVVRANGAEVLG